MAKRAKKQKEKPAAKKNIKGKTDKKDKMVKQTSGKGKADKIDILIDKFPKSSESLIAVLQEIQSKEHYLSEDSIKKVSEKLSVPLSTVFSVSTFYNAFSLNPKGKNIIQVCLGTACHVKGGNRLIDEVSMQLNVKENEVTKDGLFSMESVRCLGCCSLAPVIMINGKAYGNLTREKIKNILKDYK